MTFGGSLCFYQRLTRQQLHCHLQLQQVKFLLLRFKATLAALRKRLAGCDSSGVSSAGVESPIMTTAMADSADWLGSGACPDGPTLASEPIFVTREGRNPLGQNALGHTPFSGLTSLKRI